MAFFKRLFRREGQTEQMSVPDTQIQQAADTHIQVGWCTDVGQHRQKNEDAVLVFQSSQEGEDPLVPFGLFVLADGMGGHKSGEVVSTLAVRTAARHIVQQVYLSSLFPREHSAGQPSLTEALVEGVEWANKAVATHVPGGGTTLICALMIGSQVYLSNVGDSRVYIVTQEGLEQITRDHSLVDRLIELGQLTPEEAINHPQKNVLYRAVGQSEVLEVDTFMRSMLPGQNLLLCSDGLWGMVSREDIVRIVVTAPSAQSACNALVAAANKAGGRDNISAVVVRFP